MMGQVLIEDRHLSAADAGANIAHAIVVADLLVQVIGHRFACLSGIEHGLLLGLVIGTNQGTATAGGNHLVAVETHNAVVTEGAAELATIT